MAGNKGYRRTIYIDMDYSSVIKGSTNISSAMRALDSDFRRNSEEIKENGKASEQLALKKEYLSQKIQLQQKNVERLKEKYEKYSEELGDANKKTLDAKNRYDNARTALMKLESSLEDVNKELESQQTKLGQTITKFNDFKTAAADAGIDIDEAANKMAKVGTVLVGLGVAATKMSVDFTNNMAKVRSIADFTDTSITFENLKANALQVSGDFNVAANDMADGLYELISADTKLEDSLQAMRNSALLARTGFTSMGTSVDVLTSFTNAYNLTIAEQTALVDKLIVTQNDGKVTIDELGGAFGKIAGLAKESGVGIDELLAALSAVTSTGLPASETINALKQVISNVVKPTQQAAETANQLGLKFNSAALSSKGLVGFLEEVQRKAGGNTEALATLFGSVEAFNSVLVLTGSGANKFNESLDNIKNSAGAAQTAFNDLKTPGEELSAAINNLKNGFINAGGAFEPLVRLAANFINVVANLSPQLVQFGTVVGAGALILAGMVKTLQIANATMQLYSKIKTAIIAKTAAESAANGALAASQGVASVSGGILAGINAALGTSFTTLIVPMTIILAVIVAIVAAYLLLSKSSKDAASSMTSTTNDIKKAMNDLQSSVTTTTQKAGNIKAYASGTNYHPGGKALVGEEGPEIVELPRGSKVYTAQKTRQMLSDNSGGEQTTNNYYMQLDLSKFKSFAELESFLGTFKQSQRQTAHGV